MAWVVLGDRMRCKFPFGIVKNQILPVVVSGIAGGLVFRDAPRTHGFNTELRARTTWRTQDVWAQGIF